MNIAQNLVSPKLAKRSLNFLWAVFRTVLILGLAFVIVQPLLMSVASSFKSMADLYDPSIIFIPKDFTLENYKTVWEQIDYPVRFVNSVLYCVVCSFLQLSSCTLVAYGIARFNFKGRGIIFAMAMITLVIPPESILLSLYLQFKSFGPVTIFTLGHVMKGIDLTGSVVPMLLLSSTAVGFKNGLYIFLLRQYFRNQPKELEEAAYIDGYGRFSTFLRVMLPGSASMMATVFLFSFVWQWNDSFYTPVLSPGLEVFTTVLPHLGIMVSFSQGNVVETVQNLLYDSAGLVMHIIPLLILYLFTQKLFVQSITRSGLVE